jgi:hypothetical protein
MSNTIAKADAVQKNIDASETDCALNMKGHIKPHALMAEVSESTNKVRGRKRTSAEVFID